MIFLGIVCAAFLALVLLRIVLGGDGDFLLSASVKFFVGILAIALGMVASNYPWSK
jgi:hypothetical protein